MLGLASASAAVLATGVLLELTVSAGVLRLAPDSVVFRSLDVAVGAAGAAVPLAVLAALLRSHLHRGVVADLAAHGRAGSAISPTWVAPTWKN